MILHHVKTHYDNEKDLIVEHSPSVLSEDKLYSKSYLKQVKQNLETLDILDEIADFNDMRLRM